MNFERLKLPHIDLVTHDLWDRGITEAMIFGVRDFDDLHAYARQRLDDYHAYAAVTDNRPIAIFGAFHEANRIFTTWFFSTEDFTLFFRPLTRRLKQLIEDGGHESRMRVIQTFSPCVDPRAPKWFAVLGLQEDPYYSQNNGGHIRRFFKEFEHEPLED